MPDRIRSSDGVRLAVYEHGDPAAPTILAVHGYPDDHTVWDGVAELLADRFHVVTYDVRGTGASDAPSERSGYRMDRLVDDLAAVLDAVSPNEPAHLVGHDWGSIQCWAAVADPRLAGRIATFTSISGPSLDHAAAWLRGIGRRPAPVLRQLAHSAYIVLFQLPALPEFAVRRGVLDRGIRRATAAASGLARTRPERDELNGLELYRANMLGRLGRPRPSAIDLPVQVVVPDRDAFVTPAFAIEAPAPWVADLQVRPVRGGHWVVGERPERIAPLIADFASTRS